MGRKPGFQQTDEVKARLRELRTGRKLSPETIAKMRAARLANLAAGKGGLTPAGRAALSRKQAGKKDDDETRRKKSEAARKRCERMGLTPKAPKQPRVKRTPEEIRERERARRKADLDRKRNEAQAAREQAEAAADLRKAERKAMLIEAFQSRKSSRAG
jgi:hypothetical protein